MGVASTVVAVGVEDTKAEAVVTEEVVDHTPPAGHIAVVVVVALVEQRSPGVVVVAVEAPQLVVGQAMAVILNERHIYLQVAHHNSYLNTKCI